MTEMQERDTGQRQRQRQSETGTEAWDDPTVGNDRDGS